MLVVLVERQALRDWYTTGNDLQARGLINPQEGQVKVRLWAGQVAIVQNAKSNRAEIAAVFKRSFKCNLRTRLHRRQPDRPLVPSPPPAARGQTVWPGSWPRFLTRLMASGFPHGTHSSPSTCRIARWITMAAA